MFYEPSLRQLIPTTCTQCNFEAKVPQQIQIHHYHAKESSLLNDSKTVSSGSPEKIQKSSESKEVFLGKNTHPALGKKIYSGSSLKKEPDYNLSKELTTICANCHSLEHHTRGLSEKESCGLWLTKKTTNLPFLKYMDMFVKNLYALINTLYKKSILLGLF